jgi:hypothetical protein
VCSDQRFVSETDFAGRSFDKPVPDAIPCSPLCLKGANHFESTPEILFSSSGQMAAWYLL